MAFFSKCVETALLEPIEGWVTALHDCEVHLSETTTFVQQTDRTPAARCAHIKDFLLSSSVSKCIPFIEFVLIHTSDTRARELIRAMDADEMLEPLVNTCIQFSDEAPRMPIKSASVLCIAARVLGTSFLEKRGKVPENALTHFVQFLVKWAKFSTAKLLPTHPPDWVLHFLARMMIKRPAAEHGVCAGDMNNLAMYALNHAAMNPSLELSASAGARKLWKVCAPQTLAVNITPLMLVKLLNVAAITLAIGPIGGEEVLCTHIRDVIDCKGPGRGVAAPEFPVKHFLFAAIAVTTEMSKLRIEISKRLSSKTPMVLMATLGLFGPSFAEEVLRTGAFPTAPSNWVGSKGFPRPEIVDMFVTLLTSNSAVDLVVGEDCRVAACNVFETHLFRSDDFSKDVLNTAAAVAKNIPAKTSSGATYISKVMELTGGVIRARTMREGFAQKTTTSLIDVFSLSAIFQFCSRCAKDLCASPLRLLATIVVVKRVATKDLVSGLGYFLDKRFGAIRLAMDMMRLPRKLAIDQREDALRLVYSGMYFLSAVVNADQDFFVENDACVTSATGVNEACFFMTTHGIEKRFHAIQAEFPEMCVSHDDITGTLWRQIRARSTSFATKRALERFVTRGPRIGHVPRIPSPLSKLVAVTLPSDC